MSYIKSEIDRLDNGNPEFVSVNVSSGIVEQPLSLIETKKGAINRAKAAYNSGNEQQRLGIGLEAGLMKTKQADLKLVCVVCLFDGHSAVTTTSEPLLIPSEVTSKVQHGHEFGKVIREYAKDNHHSASYSDEALTELINREKSFRSALQKCLKQLFPVM
jgi:non-canonical (house-cleaning) NTP pyrophosphatase